MRYLTEKKITFDSTLFKKMMMFLIYSRCWNIRYKIASQGYRLDILVNDPKLTVRKEVAHQGYGLDILINDSDCIIRRIVRRKQNELAKQV